MPGADLDGVLYLRRLADSDRIGETVSSDTRLVIIGATIPDAKMAFEGNGESSVEAEVAEKRLAADKERASKAALKSAVKQAVEEAVIKLGATAPSSSGGKKPAKKKT